MNRWLFKILFVPVVWLISLLPFPLLYLKSDFLFLVVYYVIGYRKSVTLTNLRNSFPKKSDKEIRLISRKFYRHFCDVILETVKLLSISRKEFKRRCALDEESLKTFARFFESGTSLVGVMGHCGNWEWGAISHQVYFERMITGVYHPLSDKNFDAFMIKLRGRFGGDIVAMSRLYKRLLELKEKKISTTIGLIADQTAPPESAYWVTFLNQDTPVFNGPEKLARKFGYPVVYLKILPVKRGYYSLKLQVITENPRELPEGKITEMHTALLEQNIREQPFAWLWTHKRWKHKKPVQA